MASYCFKLFPCVPPHQHSSSCFNMEPHLLVDTACAHLGICHFYNCIALLSTLSGAMTSFNDAIWTLLFSLIITIDLVDIKASLEWFPSCCLLRAHGSGLYHRTCSVENNPNVKLPILEMSLCHFSRIPLMASTKIAPKKRPMTKWWHIIKRTPYLYPCQQQHYHGPLCTQSTFPTKKMSSCL
jgi:hypothetical protein